MNVNGKMTGMLALALLSVSCSRHLNDSEGNVFFSVDADSTVEVVTQPFQMPVISRLSSPTAMVTRFTTAGSMATILQPH